MEIDWQFYIANELATGNDLSMLFGRGGEARG